METQVKLLVEKAKEIGSSFSRVKEQMDEAKEWNSFSKVLNNVNGVIKLASNVVLFVEKACIDITNDVNNVGNLSNADKRKAAVVLLDDMIDFSGFSKPMEMIDGPLWSTVLSGVVYLANSKFDHAWDVNSAISQVKNGVDFLKTILK